MWKENRGCWESNPNILGSDGLIWSDGMLSYDGTAMRDGRLMWDGARFRFKGQGYV